MLNDRHAFPSEHKRQWKQTNDNEQQQKQTIWRRTKSKVWLLDSSRSYTRVLCRTTSLPRQKDLFILHWFDLIWRLLVYIELSKSLHGWDLCFHITSIRTEMFCLVLLFILGTEDLPGWTSRVSWKVRIKCSVFCYQLCFTLESNTFTYWSKWCVLWFWNDC